MYINTSSNIIYWAPLINPIYVIIYILDQLVPCLLDVFVGIEMTGQSVQFEQKFNYRRPMYSVMDFLWTFEEHRNVFTYVTCIIKSSYLRNLPVLDDMPVRVARKEPRNLNWLKSIRFLDYWPFHRKITFLQLSIKFL